jgi:HSP20 family protein
MNAPRIDLHEENGQLCLRADLPGMRAQDLDVRVDGDMLTISGERKSEQSRNERDYHVMECSHGRFRRTVQLPFTPNPDEVRAEVKHGVLELHIPKHSAQERSRRIQVKGDDTQAAGSGGGAMTQAVGGGSAAGGEHAKSDVGTTATSGAGRAQAADKSASTASGR